MQRHLAEDKWQNLFPNNNVISPKTSPTNGLVFAVHKVKVSNPTLPLDGSITSRSNGFVKIKPLSATIVNGRSKPRKFNPDYNINSAI